MAIRNRSSNKSKTSVSITGDSESVSEGAIEARRVRQELHETTEAFLSQVKGIL